MASAEPAFALEATQQPNQPVLHRQTDLRPRPVGRSAGRFFGEDCMSSRPRRRNMRRTRFASVCLRCWSRFPPVHVGGHRARSGLASSIAPSRRRPSLFARSTSSSTSGGHCEKSACFATSAITRRRSASCRSCHSIVSCLSRSPRLWAVTARSSFFDRLDCAEERQRYRVLIRTKFGSPFAEVVHDIRHAEQIARVQRRPLHGLRKCFSFPGP